MAAFINVSVDRKVSDRILRMFANKDDIKKDMDRIAHESAEFLRNTIVANASGRPGPEIQTGEYVNSWQVVEEGEAAATVYSFAPQALRLEYGFVGVDSAGRNYVQPPFPHINPAIEQTRKKFSGEVMKGYKAYIRRFS